jgi:hypothetical protein
LGRRSAPRQFAVTHQGQDEEDAQVHEHLDDERVDRNHQDDDDEPEDEQRLELDHQRMRDDWASLKDNDEGQQIERQRQRPQQRY